MSLYPGTVYKIGADDFSGQCEDPEGVDGCENYYGDELKHIKKSELLLGLDGNYNNNKGTSKPTLRKKVQQTPRPEVQSAPSQVNHNRVQQISSRDRIRPTAQQQNQPAPQQTPVSRPIQQQQRPAPVQTTPK